MYSDMALRVNLRETEKGVRTFHYDLGDAFFESIGTEEISGGKLTCELSVARTGSFYTLDFDLRGVVSITCDRCLGRMEQPIETTGHLVATLGESFSDDGEIVTVAEQDGMLDVAWHIYEFTELAIPLQHTHPEGQCDATMTRLLAEHTATEERDATRPADGWKTLERLLEDDNREQD